jgi:hypothetical protein
MYSNRKIIKMVIIVTNGVIMFIFKKNLVFLLFILNICSSALPQQPLPSKNDNVQSSSSSSHTEQVSSIEKPQKIVLGNRPKAIQTAVDNAFEKNFEKQKDVILWYFDGSSTNYYLFNLDDERVLKHLASHSQEKDIYIIDVGCGKGAWGTHAMEVLLSDEACKKSGKNFHIFSVTGSKECETSKIQKGNVTHYLFNQFKIENIDEEFLKRGFDLTKKVNFMVSRWTLRHLVDPFGTLKRMYGLLSPSQGMLLSNGFLFAFDDQEEIQSFPTSNWDILASTNAVPLFRMFGLNGDLGEFLLMRNDNQELDLPLVYTGKMRSLTSIKYQCASEMVTVFKNGSIDNKEEFFFIQADQDDNELEVRGLARYCDKYNPQSKNLYEYLKNEQLFRLYDIF